jgi:2-dehydro-3-deoxyglucarate aldolase/4-hydroxy-2-oxoheptanedioate aldolase
MLVSSPEQARQWKDAGALLLVYQSDVEVMHTGFSQAMSQIRGG